MDDEPCCGHTKIKEVSWKNEGHSTSSKFMCLDCNTDFVPLAPSIRRAMYAQEAEVAQIQQARQCLPGCVIAIPHASKCRVPS